MISDILDRLGEWNPQFYREIKGKFTCKNLTIAVFCSAIFQWFIYQSSALETFDVLNYVIPGFLFSIGFYSIGNDLAREEQRGTLNFIRLSPQSSQSILLGKMLGVPSLICFACILAIPLHLIIGLIRGIPVLQILGLYLLWIAGCCLFYNLACFYTLSACNQNSDRVRQPQFIAGMGFIIASILTTIYLSIVYALIFSASSIEFDWFLIPIGRNLLLDYAWLLTSIAGVNYVIWQAINRCFRNFNVTVISKSQSYQLMLGINLWTLGFVFHDNSPQSSHYYSFGFFWLYFAIPFVFLFLIAILMPNRQYLLDWSRYRHQNYTRDRGIGKDLLWGEKSPAILAIAINLLITAIVWLPWLLLLPAQALSDSQLTKIEATLGLLLMAVMVLIYSAIAHIMSLKLRSRSGIVAMSFVVTIAILPIIAASVLSIENIQLPAIALLSPFPILFIMNNSLVIAVLGWFGQIAILGLLARRFTKQIETVGASATQTLLSQAN